MLKVLDTTTKTEETPATPTLDDLAREGARRMLMAALQVEVAQYVDGRRVAHSPNCPSSQRGEAALDSMHAVERDRGRAIATATPAPSRQAPSALTVTSIIRRQ